MAIISYPYTSVNGDRKVTASQMAEGLGAIATSGVSTNDGDLLCSKVADSMQVSVAPGKAFIAGHFISVNAAETVALVSGGAEARTDIVVLESFSGTDALHSREAFINVVSELPTDDTKIPLCSVYVPAGATNLNSAILTDMRAFSYGKHKHGAANFDDGVITSEKLANNAVTTAKINDSAVAAAKISANAVTEEKIADSAVTTTKIADSAVTDGKINAGAVTENKIGSNSVTAVKIADGAVTANKIGTGAVTTDKIAAEAITAVKIGNGSVTQAKLGTIQSITLDSGDTITYDTASNKLKLNVSGCTSVMLAPMVIGTSATAPAGTYPAGTIYVQYTE